MIGPKDLRSFYATRISEEIKVDPDSKPAELSAGRIYCLNYGNFKAAPVGWQDAAQGNDIALIP